MVRSVAEEAIHLLRWMWLGSARDDYVCSEISDWKWSLKKRPVIAHIEATAKGFLIRTWKKPILRWCFNKRGRVEKTTRPLDIRGGRGPRKPYMWKWRNQEVVGRALCEWSQRPEIAQQKRPVIRPHQSKIERLIDLLLKIYQLSRKKTKDLKINAVSYTHLTLPTIYSV